MSDLNFTQKTLVYQKNNPTYPHQREYEGLFLKTREEKAEQALQEISEINKKLENLTSPQINQNLIINGDFSIWQRPFGMNEEIFLNTFIADQWQFNVSGGGSCSLYNYGRYMEDLFNSSNYLSIINNTVGTPPDNYAEIKQAVECYITKDEQYTVSFDAMGEIGTKIQVNFHTNTKEFILTSKSMKIISTFTILNPYKSNPELSIRWFNEKFGTVFHIANVKLEKGNTATMFIPDLPAVSLLKCQRYYERGTVSQNITIPNNSDISSYYIQTINYKVTKCSRPDVRITSSFGINPNGPAYPFIIKRPDDDFVNGFIITIDGSSLSERQLNHLNTGGWFEFTWEAEVQI